jgi:hypothetical protein
MDNSLQIPKERSSILLWTKHRHPPSSKKEINLFPPEIDILSTVFSSLPFSLLLSNPSLKLIYVNKYFLREIKKDIFHFLNRNIGEVLSHQGSITVKNRNCKGEKVEVALPVNQI